MKELKSYEDLKKEFIFYRALPMAARKFIDTKDFNGFFKCGCGGQHEIEGTEITQLMFVAHMRFVFKCKKNICSMVKVKGVFKTKLITEWFCKSKLVYKFIEETNYYDLDDSSGPTKLI